MGGPVSLVESFVHQKESPHTRRAYRRDLRAFFGQTEVTKDLVCGVDHDDIDAFLARGESSGLAESTLRRRRSALRQFFDWLTAEGVVTSNPARHGRIRTPMARPASTSGQEKSSGPLSRDQAEKLVASIDGSTAVGRRNRALVMLVLHCALRRGELVRVNVDDFRLVGRYRILEIRDSESGSTSISGSDQTKSGHQDKIETLSGRAKVPEHVYRHVQAVRMDVDVRVGALFRSYSNRNRGARITGDSVYRVVRDAGQAIDIDALTPDRLRQTGLQLALESGATGDQVRAHGRYAASAPYSARHEERLRDSAADYVEVGENLSISGA
ncbi:hypothetical protein CRI94_01920 [Longibacter salinarum]|uniref:Integrase n=1 Tax=Longibacter salinarum TaxID=1850348 RepID=A0A2A8D350_9BACT|nr:site-specific integrase [Longibacter salinarum]PEN15068.1 hypothetical protein CRI94_01920 [Longibacter salinarum]